MTEQQTIPDRAAAARAARSLRAQQKLAERLASAGWTCHPPVPPAVRAWQLDAAAEIGDLIDGRTLVVGGGPGSEHDRSWDVHTTDEEGFRPGPGRATLICHDRPCDPVVVEVAVRIVMGQVP